MLIYFSICFDQVIYMEQWTVSMFAPKTTEKTHHSFVMTLTIIRRNNIVTIFWAWNRNASFRLTQWLKIIPHVIRSYYRRCCINEPVIISHCVNLTLGHRFHALLIVCFDRDDIVPLIFRREIYLQSSCQNVNV